MKWFSGIRTCAQVACIASVLPSALHAQTAAISSTQPVTIGQAVSFVITGTGDSVESWCGFRIDFGDGNGEDVKVERSQPFPKRMTYTYAKAGTYVATATGKRVTTHIPCPINVQTTVNVNPPLNTPSPLLASPTAPALNRAAVFGPNCPQQVMVKSASGQEVAFNLRDMIVEAGGVANAREQVSRRIIDAQSKALDESINANERNAAKTFANSLLQLRTQLANCGS